MKIASSSFHINFRNSNIKQPNEQQDRVDNRDNRNRPTEDPETLLDIDVINASKIE